MGIASRRKFIKRLSQLGIGIGLIDTMFEQIIFGVFKEAYASSNINAYNYLGIYLAGGYPRWMYDLPINQAVGIDRGHAVKNIYNPMIFTGFDQKAHGQFTKKYELNSEGLPPLWSDANISTLKSSMTIIRGMDNLAIHPAWIKQFKPRNDKVAVHGILSENGSSHYFPNMSLNMRNINLGLKSGLSSSMIKFGVDESNTIIEKITKIFSSDKVIDSTINQKVDQALFKLKNLGAKYNVNSNRMHESLQKARELLLLSLNFLSDKFEERYIVYQSKWAAGVTTTLIGLDDSAISTEIFNVNLDGQTSTKFFAGTPGKHHGDLRNLVINSNGLASNNLLCASLAFSEVMLGFHSDLKFTNSLIMDSGHMTLTSGRNLGGDVHGMGAIPQGYLFTKFFQGFSYCMDEFIKECKNKNQFDKTLVHLGSEFSRSCRIDGSGSDHGGAAGIATIFTGINSSLPRIVGELAETGWSNGKWKGHWGQNSSGFSSQDVFNFIEHLYNIPTAKRSFGDKNKVIEACLGTTSVAQND